MSGTLNTIDTVSSGDKFVIYSANDGQYEGATLQTVADAIEPLLTTPGSYSTQNATTTATGQTVVVVAGTLGQTDIRLIIQPGGTYLNTAITLPLASTSVDHQRLLVTSTQAMTNLSFNLNGAVAAPGAPASMSANGFFMLMFDMPTLQWYRVG